MKVISNTYIFSHHFFFVVLELNILACKHFYCGILKKNLVNQIKNFQRKSKYEFQSFIRSKFIESKLLPGPFLGTEHTAVNETEKYQLSCVSSQDDKDRQKYVKVSLRL